MRYLIVIIVLLSMSSNVYALGCDVDYYSPRPDGGMGYDDTVTFIICPISCPDGTTPSNVAGDWQCVGGFIMPPLEVICGNGLPCGPVPWDLPQFPVLASPTPMSAPPPPEATDEAAAPEITPEPETTPEPEATAEAELSDVMDFLAEVTPVVEPPSFDEPWFVELTGDMTDFFGYFKGLLDIDLGIFNAPLVAVASLFGLTIALKFTLYIIPVISALIGLIRKIYHMIPGL